MHTQKEIQQFKRMGLVKCRTCYNWFRKTSPRHYYCGSYLRKEGCSYLNFLELSRKSHKRLTKIGHSKLIKKEWLKKPKNKLKKKQSHRKWYIGLNKERRRELYVRRRKQEGYLTFRI